LEVRHIGGSTHWRLDALGARRVGGSTQWSLDALEARRIGGSTRWRLDALEARHIGGSTHWRLATLKARRIEGSTHWRLDALKARRVGGSTHCRLDAFIWVSGLGWLRFRCSCLSCLVAVWLRRFVFVVVSLLSCGCSLWFWSLGGSNRARVLRPSRSSSGRVLVKTCRFVCSSLFHCYLVAALCGAGRWLARTVRVCCAQVRALAGEFSSRAAGLERGGALPSFAKPASLKPWRAPTRCLTTPEGIPRARHAKVLCSKRGV
jgi:hypothetical protein